MIDIAIHEQYSTRARGLIIFNEHNKNGTVHNAKTADIKDKMG